MTSRSAWRTSPRRSICQRGGSLDSRPVSCGLLKAVLDALASQGMTLEKELVWAGPGTTNNNGSIQTPYQPGNTDALLIMADLQLKEDGPFITMYAIGSTSGYINDLPRFIYWNGSKFVGTNWVYNNSGQLTFGLNKGYQAKNLYKLRIKQ